MTFEELLLALDEHSNLISNETKIGHNTNVRVGLLGKKVAEIFRKQGDAGERYLSKIDDDIAKGIITFLKGIVIGDFSPGLFGSGGAIKNINGTIVAEFDQLLIRQRAEFLSVLIHQAKHVGGQLVLSAADMTCIRVEETSDFYRCYFDSDGGKVVNLFENTDFARHQIFTGNRQKFYWRKIVAVGPDYIELSKTDAAINSDAPEVGDDIYQLGSTNPERQSAIILSTVGDDAPSIKQLVDINTYILSKANEYTVLSRKGNKFVGRSVFLSDGTNLDDWTTGTSQDIQDTQATANTAALKAQQAIDEAAANVVDYNTKFAEIQAQVDGEISNYSYPYKPTLLNYPASEWTTDIERDRHIGDTFYNSQAYVDAETTPDAGKAWRFVKNSSTYSWTPIADSDAVKALRDAAKAQAMADGKSTTHFFKPDTPKADGYCYKLGDMWVLNTEQTLNGIAYKAGEILTATQDSATFVQTHWGKRVRYTDDSAVENLQIGGVNLLDGTSDQWTTATTTSAPYINNFFPNTILEVGQEYTFSFESEIVSGTPSGVVHIGCGTTDYQRDILYSNVPIVGKNKVTFKPTASHLTSGTKFAFRWYNNGAVFTFRYRKLKLEKGNKASDWDLSKKDRQDKIDAAKIAAETAAKSYADTKAEAERILAEIYADGIVDTEEQARIADVNAKLAAAKAYAEAQDALLKTQQEAYADGKASAAELAAIAAAETYANLKKTEAEAYADGKVSAEEARAIADATAKFNDAKAHADTLVNNIQIGGRNLFSINNFVADNKARGYSTISVIEHEGNIAYRSSNISLNHYIPRYLQGKFEANTQYYFKFNILWESYTNSAAQYIFTIRYTDGTTSTLYATTSQTYRALLSAANKTIDYITTTRQYSGNVVIYNIQLEKANKPSDWTPAIEDVQYDINKAMADANLARAITDKFGTTINNGLVATVILLLRELNSQQDTAGLSGIQGASRNQPSYWSGGNYAKAQAFVPFVVKLENEQSTSLEEYNNLPSIVFLHSGAAKVGHFIVLTSGEILIIDPATGSVKLKFTTAELPSIIDLVTGTNSQDSTVVGAGVASISSSQVVSGSTVVSKNGATATFNGTNLSISARGIVQEGGMASFAEAVLYARKNGVRVQRLSSVTVHFTNTFYEDKSADALPVPFSFPIDAGTYTFELVIHTTGSVNSGNAVTSASNLSWKHTVAGVKKQQYSKDGMMFFYSNRHFYFSESEGFNVKESDSSKFNLPGVLLSATVASLGGWASVWGAKQSTVAPYKNSTGRYTIYHTLGHSNYQVYASSHSASRSYNIVSKGPTSFIIEWRTIGSTPALSDTTFDFQMIGNNYS